MDVGFIALCPDRALGGLKNSVGSINHQCYKRESIAVVGKDVTTKEMKEFKEICPTYKGQDTITSLVNIGMKRLKHEWGCLFFAGSRVSLYVETKFKFATSEKDVLYPLVENKFGFVDASFNGVFINKAFFKEVGDFPTYAMEKQGMNDFEMAKLFWALDAIEKGAIFKGIVGLRII